MQGSSRWLLSAALSVMTAAVVLSSLFVAHPVIAADEPLPLLPSVAPSTPWLPLLPSEAVLTRIGVGSCLDQRHPEPIWPAVIAAKPQLFLMVGDNVYGDVKGADMAELVTAYRTQAAHPEFKAAREAFPFLAMWDDHDYGANDAGGTFPHAGSAAKLFHDFWQLKPERDRGVYYARTFGPEGRRVQIIMLDVRSFRSPLKLKGPEFPHWGRFQPDTTPGKTMLGEEQWAWLEAELRKSAELRLVVSGIQILAEGHGFERWGNLPAERERLMKLIDETKANGVVLISGDRHMAALYVGTTPAGREIPELTASSLNRSYGPSRDARVPPLVTEPYHPENFGLLDIDWAAAHVSVSLRGMGGESIWSRQIALGSR